MAVKRTESVRTEFTHFVQVSLEPGNSRDDHALCCEWKRSSKQGWQNHPIASGEVTVGYLLPAPGVAEALQLQVGEVVPKHRPACMPLCCSTAKSPFDKFIQISVEHSQAGSAVDTVSVPGQAHLPEGLRVWSCCQGGSWSSSSQIFVLMFVRNYSLMRGWTNCRAWFTATMGRCSQRWGWWSLENESLENGVFKKRISPEGS